MLASNLSYQDFKQSTTCNLPVIRIQGSLLTKLLIEAFPFMILIFIESEFSSEYCIPRNSVDTFITPTPHYLHRCLQCPLANSGQYCTLVTRYPRSEDKNGLFYTATVHLLSKCTGKQHFFFVCVIYNLIFAPFLYFLGNYAPEVRNIGTDL